MKYIAIIATACFSLLTSTAYAHYYLYVENPDPENFEIVTDPDFLLPNQVADDEKGSRSCWIIKDSQLEIWPVVTIQHKVSHSIVCKIYPSHLEGQEVYEADGSCSFFKQEKEDRGLWPRNKVNTWWFSAAAKADWSPAQAYQTWDCG